VKRITKRAKKVDITYKTVTAERSEYVCPSCRTTFIGSGIGKNITRFICDCGQELIVNKIKRIENSTIKNNEDIKDIKVIKIKGTTNG
jgi:hypothetical protein